MGSQKRITQTIGTTMSTFNNDKFTFSIQLTAYPSVTNPFAVNLWVIEDGGHTIGTVTAPTMERPQWRLSVDWESNFVYFQSLHDLMESIQKHLNS